MSAAMEFKINTKSKMWKRVLFKGFLIKLGYVRVRVTALCGFQLVLIWFQSCT